MALTFTRRPNLESETRGTTKKTCRVNFFGDVSLYNLDVENFRIDTEILELSKSAHLNVANLESPLTHSTNRRPYKHVYMKGVPKPSHVLELFDAFTLANNHMLDYTEQGLTDTLDFLSTIDKKSFGVGVDRDGRVADGATLDPVAEARDEGGRGVSLR